jgi:hypothetical protein
MSPLVVPAPIGNYRMSDHSGLVGSEQGEQENSFSSVGMNGGIMRSLAPNTSVVPATLRIAAKRSGSEASSVSRKSTSSTLPATTAAASTTGAKSRHVADTFVVGGITSSAATATAATAVSPPRSYGAVLRGMNRSQSSGSNNNTQSLTASTLLSHTSENGSDLNASAMGSNTPFKSHRPSTPQDGSREFTVINHTLER